MDAKITKNRISGMLSYDWLKIVAVAVALILFWSLLFTLTATKITNAQQFVVFNHYANNALDEGYKNHIDGALANGKFSYEILETKPRDLTTAKDEVYRVTTACLDAGEGDVLFVPNIPDTERPITNDAGETSYPFTCLEGFFLSYYSYTADVEALLLDMQTLVVSYFGEDYENGTLDEAKAERDFRARVETLRDDRFRRETQIVQGIAAEKERLTKYRDGLVQLNGYLADGTVRLEEVTLKDENGAVRMHNGAPFLQGRYALNICPTSATAAIKNQFSYKNTTESGATDTTAANMCVMFLDLREEDKAFRYESVLYVNALIESALAANA